MDRDAVRIGEYLPGRDVLAGESRRDESESRRRACDAGPTPRVETQMVMITVCGEKTGAGIGTLRHDHPEGGTVKRVAAVELGDAQVEVAPVGSREGSCGGR